MPVTTETNENALRDEASSAVDERMRTRYGKTNEETRFPDERPYFHADERARWYNTSVARQALPANANAAIWLIALSAFGWYLFQDLRETKSFDRAQMSAFATAISGKASKADLKETREQIGEANGGLRDSLTRSMDQVTRSMNQVMQDHMVIRKQFGTFGGQLTSFEGRLRQMATQQQQQIHAQAAQAPQLRGTVTPAAKLPGRQPNPQYVIPIEPPARDTGGGNNTTAETPDSGPDVGASFPIPHGVIASKDGGNRTVWHVFANSGRGDEVVTPVREINPGPRSTFEVLTPSGATCVLSNTGQWLSCDGK